MTQWILGLHIDSGYCNETLPGIDRRGFCAGNITPGYNVEKLQKKTETHKLNRKIYIGVVTCNNEGFNA